MSIKIKIVSFFFICLLLVTVGRMNSSTRVFLFVRLRSR